MFGIRDIQNETKLLKHVTNPTDLTVSEKLFNRGNEDLVTYFDISSENDLIRKFCGWLPEVSKSVRNT